MPRASCPKCGRLLYPIKESYYCRRCNLKFGEVEKNKEDTLSKKDLEFLKNAKVKWE